MHRWLLFYNPIFSAAQRTILATLCNGACLCLAGRDVMATSLFAVVDALKIDALGITPSALAMLNANDCPSCLKQISTVGEPIGQAVVDAWASKVTLRVSYGLSECAMLNMSRQIYAGDNPRVVAPPSDTTTAMILRPEDADIAEAGDIGELCLSGPQLSSGYLGLPEITAARFINIEGKRIFRTGDAARKLLNGDIEITGRLDYMMKINGQRVEPGEIQTVLENHQLVKSAAIFTAKVNDTSALVAAVVLEKEMVDSWGNIISQLRSFAQDHLPQYMVPSFWQQYEILPRNNNGKVDIKQLRDSAEASDIAAMTARSTSEAFVPATQPDQISLRNAWAEVLNVDSETIGVNDSFINLGGTSMQAIRVIQKMRQNDLEVELADILQGGSLGSVPIKASKTLSNKQLHRLELVTDADDKRKMMENRDIVDVYPATPLQESILASTLQGNNDYLYQRLFSVGHLDIQRLKLAVYGMFVGRETLRSTFVTGSKGMYQVIRSDFKFPWQELTMPVSTFCEKDKAEGFELGQPHVRFTILNGRVLVVSMHHTLFDFWSHGFFFNDVAAMYLRSNFVERPHWSLYADYVSRIDVNKMESFWQTYLADAKPTVVNHAPTALSVFASRRLIMNPIEVHRFSGLTTGALVYTAWAMVLSRHTGNDEVTFATTISGREIPLPSVDRIDGPTLTMVPQRIFIHRDKTLKENALEGASSMMQMMRHSQYGMRRAIKAAGVQSVSSLLDTMVNILPKADNLAARDVDYVFQKYGPTHPWKTEFTMLEVAEGADGLEIRLSSNMESRRLEFMIDQVCNAIIALIKTPDKISHDVCFIGSSEKEFLVSHEPLDEQSLRFLHQGFEQMSKAKPETVAISWQDGTDYTYEQVNAMANQMARFLQSKSISRGAKVPLILEKGIHMVTAMLGVLKCGAAYVPLSSENPLERNMGIIKEVEATVVLTESAQGEYLKDASSSDFQLVMLDQLDLAAFSTDDLQSEIGPEDDAYLIYTSGSTGTPKGVVVPHRAVAATVHSLIKSEGRFDGEEWRTLQFSQYVFDVSVYDIFVTLSSGGTLCLAETESLLSDLAGTIRRLRVTHAFLTPSVARLIKPEDVPMLKTLVVGGEQVTTEIVTTWADKVRLINGYGPTETAVLITTREIRPGSQANNIGCTLATAHAVIVDPTPGNDSIVPYGAVGELCFSGPQLAHGYYHRDEQTAAAWERSSVVATTGGVMYRSGDLARFLPGKEIECLGRKDGQVKINGLRIELGEVEQRIMKENDVVDCAAMVGDWKGKPTLVAFAALVQKDKASFALLPASDEWVNRAQTIKQTLMLNLTPYMIPKAIFPLTAMPRSLSGKTDKKKLKAILSELSMSELSAYALDCAAGSGSDFLPIETEAQKLVHKAWQEVLRTEDMEFGRNATFLDLGGDSIEAINLASNLRSKGITITVAQILKSANLAAMAEFVNLDAVAEEEEVEEVVYKTPAAVEEAVQAVGLAEQDVEYIYPCPPGQSEFLTQGARVSQHWDLMAVRQLPAGADIKSWSELTKQLTQTNDILRTTFTKYGGQWYGVVLKSADPFIYTQKVTSDADRKEAIENLWQSRFEFGKAFVKYLVLEHDDGALEIVTKMDHGLYDGTLLRIFAAHFGAYQDEVAVPPFTSFKDYAFHEFSSNKRRALKFWTESSRVPTEDFNYPTLPVSEPGPKTDVAISATTVMMSDIPTLEASSRALGSTVSILYQAAFQLWLARKAGNLSEVQLDYLYTGRNVALPDPQSINGPCANFLPLRFPLNKSVTVQQYLDAVADEFWAATENGNVGLDDIYAAANGTRDQLRNGALYLFQPFNPPPPKQPGTKEKQGWVIMAKSEVTQPQPYGLVFEVAKTPTTAYRMKVGYDGRIFSENEAKQVGKEVHMLLENLIKDGGRKVEEVIGV